MNGICGPGAVVVRWPDGGADVQCMVHRGADVCGRRRRRLHKVIVCMLPRYFVSRRIALHGDSHVSSKWLPIKAAQRETSQTCAQATTATATGNQLRSHMDGAGAR